MKFGLTEEEIKQICNIFSLYPEIETVLIFGSRATGNYKKTSDIDLALKGHISIDIITKIRYQLEESTTLPYFFDVVDYYKIKNIKFKKLIDEQGKILYHTHPDV